MIACDYSWVFIHFISKISQKVLVERKSQISQPLAVSRIRFLGAVVEAYQCGSEDALISGVIAELIFKAH